MSTYMQTSLETLQKYKNYIINALHYSYSNGVMEGTNNLIKVPRQLPKVPTRSSAVGIRWLASTNSG
ncbi:MAG: transposase [Alistipes sp.]